MKVKITEPYWVTKKRKEKELMHAALKALKRLRPLLLEEKNLALGCWGIPEGAIPTFSRGSWYRRAEEYMTEEEKGTLKRYWAGLWIKDLSD